MLIISTEDNSKVKVGQTNYFEYMTAYLTSMADLEIPVKTGKNAAFTTRYEKCVTCPATQSTTPAKPATDEATNTFKAFIP